MSVPSASMAGEKRLWTRLSGKNSQCVCVYVCAGVSGQLFLLDMTLLKARVNAKWPKRRLIKPFADCEKSSVVKPL